MVCEDGEDHVFGRAAVVEFAHQLKPDGFGDLHEGEPRTDEVGVLGGPNAPRQRVRGTAHAGVRVGCLNEIANFDKLLSGHLVADARRHAVNGGIVAHPGVLLESDLEVAQRLNFVHEGHELWVVLGVEEVVFKDGELAGIRQRIVLAVFGLQE